MVKRVTVLLCTKFEVSRPSLSEDIWHLLCNHLHLIGLVTLAFDLLTSKYVY